MAEPMIEINGLKKYFKSSKGLLGLHPQYVRAVDDVCLTVRKGEVMGLVGESGSGKTTLARCILNLTKPTESTVHVDGHDVFRASGAELKSLRKKVTVVFQDPASNLNPRQTVEHSIMRPMLIHGVPRPEAKRRARETLSLVKMDERYLDAYPAQLSGGQQQRIAIARALVLEPTVMILDEPTSALDISVQAQVLNLLLDLQEELGLTYLIITHDLNVIRYVCDRVAVMYLGKLVEYGTTDQVTRHPVHPYTRGLMSATPNLDPHRRAENKHRLSGDPGSLVDIGPGCRFQPRCIHAAERCAIESPPMREFEEGHFASCFVADALTNSPREGTQ